MTKWQRGSSKKIGEVNHCLIEYQKRKPICHALQATLHSDVLSTLF